jgi:hypothetical protein
MTQADLQSILDAKVKEIRGRQELTPIAKRARIAQVYKPLKAEADQRDQAAKEQHAAIIQKATSVAFGVGHLASTPGDAALTHMAYRQAAAQVDTTTDPAQAAQLLAQAKQSGDTTMAIAVRPHAFTMSGHGLADPGWAQVLSDSVKDDPKAFAAVETLLSERNRGPLPAGTFDNMLVPPSELGNASNYEVERYIAEDPSAAQAGVS